MNVSNELLWAILPEGLEEWFDVESFKKGKDMFRIVLVEKNVIPELPEMYRGKKVTNTVLKPLTINDFPIRGRKGEIVMKRRCWKFEGVDKMLKREIGICAQNTKLEKEFASFLKVFYRD